MPVKRPGMYYVHAPTDSRCATLIQLAPSQLLSTGRPVSSFRPSSSLYVPPPPGTVFCPVSIFPNLIQPSSLKSNSNPDPASSLYHQHRHQQQLSILSTNELLSDSVGLANIFVTTATAPTDPMPVSAPIDIITAPLNKSVTTVAPAPPITLTSSGPSLAGLSTTAADASNTTLIDCICNDCQATGAYSCLPLPHYHLHHHMHHHLYHHISLSTGLPGRPMSPVLQQAYPYTNTNTTNTPTITTISVSSSPSSGLESDGVKYIPGSGVLFHRSRQPP
ncbi:unnamed protein product, partial [Protopolystoma xenopodis]